MNGAPLPPLRFEYHYEFLPAGIITRFIVRLHELILEKDETKLCWREGAYLHWENSEALVMVIPHQKRILIEIAGENPPEFLAIIRAQIQAIHQTIKKIKVVEKIPCPCQPDCEYRFKYDFLSKIRKLGENLARCQESAENVDIRSLLEGLKTKERKGSVHVFLSYAREDKKKARQLFSWLKQQNELIPWMDESDLKGGQEWAREIKTQLKKSRHVLVLGSKKLTDKVGFVQQEIRWALDFEKLHPPNKSYLIPLRVEDCTLHPDLENFHQIDLFPDWGKGLQKLLNSFKKKRGENSH